MEIFIRLDGKRSLTTYERGEQARESWDLDQLEQEPGKISMIFPPQTLVVTCNFISVLFGPGVKKMGCEGIKEKYVFIAQPTILQGIYLDLERLGSNHLKP